MKRLSQQRKETDVEYEEKRTTMSLTQAELVRGQFLLSPPRAKVGSQG
jgi:hypothetical protein